MASVDDLAFRPMHELMREMSEGRLSSVTLTESCLDRIARFDGKLHSFIAVYADEARMAAEAADKAIRSGHRIGPLHGMPIALKDLVDLEGRVTTGGSRYWDKRISPLTATLARKAIAAGMIVIGKTHTVEFAFGSWGTNEHLGAPRNPWDDKVHRTPGGSSSGSGVAVGAGLVPAAIGTDTGGSVRVPAAWCGHVGLKVTIGRISTHGVLPLSTTLDTPGPMVRGVEDAAILLELLQGPDENDPQTLRLRPVEALRNLKRGVRGLRLGRMPAAERQGCEPEVLAAYDAALAKLAELGAEIVDARLPNSLADYAAATGRIISSEGYRFLAELVDNMNLPLDSAVRPRVLSGKGVSARDYLLTLAERDQRKHAYLAAIEGIDALLTPTCQTVAIPLASVDQSKTSAYFTRPVNYLEQCALSLPNGFTAAGLPTSLQISARGGDEATALRVGWAYEQATDWHKRRPPGL